MQKAAKKLPSSCRRTDGPQIQAVRQRIFQVEAERISDMKTTALPHIKLYDKNLSRIDTPQGTLSLFAIFLPLLVESLLTNSMGTVNTLILSQYSDDAVAAVGTANQLLSMIYTFYTVISAGTSIFISHRLGAKKRTRLQTPPSLPFSAASCSVFWLEECFPCFPSLS